MAKKKSVVIGSRAWRLLRLSLVWARKGGLFRAISFHKLIRKLVHSDESRRALVYGDHEFSFDETPIIHVKMHRRNFKMPHLPCIQPQFAWEDDEEDEEEEGIDVKAEKFIAEFYEQMRRQQQQTHISYLHDDE